MNSLDAMIQIFNNPLLLDPLLIFILSVSFYAFSGIYLTKELNTITRIVFDSFKVIIVWTFTVASSWQEYHSIQVSFILIIFLMIPLKVINDFSDCRYLNDYSWNLYL